ncbi:MAG TPA: DegT/DnrJ/EryC1/StrS aminotransferase family protein [Streptosporangiaceae bacterium]|nr:DegT/DnrJ/EryC1/StrS aminotransferase family protein [Streptosporangiaceae bacterium]
MPSARIVFPAADRAEIAAAISQILASGSLTLGPYTRRFEEEFASAHEAPYATATASGTSALDIALRTVGVRGQDVIVPANTFFATAAAVLQAGGNPVFADVDAATFVLSRATVEEAITPQTTAVVIVHIGGLISPAIEGIARLCEERGIALVEDAAHAHGSTYQGRHAGSFGIAAAFSFYPTKVVTSGEGGMLITTSKQVNEEARIYRDQGKGAFTANHHVRLGYAWRMSEQNAATGVVHLRRLPEFMARRREVAARYGEALAGLDGLEPLEEPAGCRSNIYKYIALLPEGADRDSFKRQVAEQHDVRLSGEVYDVPLHKQPVFADHEGLRLPVSEDLAARHVCLPVHSDMTDDEVDQVLTAVTAVYGALTRV